MKQAICSVATLILPLFLIVGCQRDPSAHEYATTAPLEREIVGKYVPDSASRKERIELPMSGVVLPINPSAAIILSGNHTAQFVRVPTDLEGKQPCSVTGRGSWSIGQVSGRYYGVYIRIRNEEPNSRCKDFNWPLLLYGKEPPYRLHEIIDDPDLGEVVQYEKQL